LSPLLWCPVVDDLIARLNGSGIYTQGYADNICLLAVQKFPNSVLGLVQWALDIVDTWCNEVRLLVYPDKPGLDAFIRRRQLPNFLNHTFLGSIYVALCQSSFMDSSEFSSDFKGACECQSKEASHHVMGLQQGLWCDTGSETQGHPLALRLYHYAVHHFFVHSLVAWLSDN
jgi:hypothetical protein